MEDDDEKVPGPYFLAQNLTGRRGLFHPSPTLHRLVYQINFYRILFLKEQPKKRFLALAASEKVDCGREIYLLVCKAYSKKKKKMFVGPHRKIDYSNINNGGEMGIRRTSFSHARTRTCLHVRSTFTGHGHLCESINGDNWTHTRVPYVTLTFFRKENKSSR